jgi:regulator of protease activity HflC (stomatin/prohibitin superfamily)
MFLFIVGILLILVGVVVILVGGVGAPRGSKAMPVGIGIVIALLGGGAWLSQTFYQNDSGEASVLVNAGGQIAGQELSPGFHTKAPWQSVKSFNIRNQQISFIGSKGDTDYSGGSAQGPSVSATDNEGVKSEIDVNVRYSLTPSKVTDIYRLYKDEQGFVANYVNQNMRGVIRKVPNSYTTLDVITKQSKLQGDIQTALETYFTGSGVTIDDVSVQNIEPPKAIQAGYARAQQAQIQVSAEKAKLEAVQVSAQQQVVQAKAQAQANAELSKGLTSQVLQSRYIDALKIIGQKGNLVVVPAGSNPNIYTGKK